MKMRNIKALSLFVVLASSFVVPTVQAVSVQELRESLANAWSGTQTRAAKIKEGVSAKKALVGAAAVVAVVAGVLAYKKYKANSDAKA